MAGRRTMPEELKVPWGVGRALLVFALVWIGLPVAIVLIARGLSPYLPPMHWFLQGLRDSNIDALFIEAAVDAIAGLGLIYYLLRRFKLGFAAVGWRKFKPGQALLILAGIFIAFTVGIGILLALVAVLIPSFNANQTQSNDFTGSAGLHHPIIAILALVIIPPIIEETTFRGFIFPALSKRFGLWFGAITSSILFGFAHLQANVSIYTWLLGMLLCWMYVKTKSIFPGMGLHMLNNLLAYLALSSK